jgi:hypothetical protein
MDWTCPKKFWSPLVSIYNTGFSLRAFSYESPLVEKEVLERRQYCKLETGWLQRQQDFLRQERPIERLPLRVVVKKIANAL